MAKTRTTDISTLLGIAIAFALVGTAITLGGSASAFIDVPSILIVIGGTFAIVLACFSFREFFRLPGVVFQTIVYTKTEPNKEAQRMLQLAETARAKEGLLGLQNQLNSVNPFLRKGLQLVIDGVEPEKAELVLNQDMQSFIERHSQGASLLRKAAEVSPAMGLIGTLIGLVQMLGNLENPDTIGPAMAVALLTTMYGAMLSFLVFTPLASKLERNTKEELLIYRLQAKGVVAIGKKENPRQLQTVLNTILPPTQRVTYFN